MKIYLLYHDRDTGAREDWNIFYTPCEVFLDPAQRQARMDFLQQRYDGLGIEFECQDVEPRTNITEPHDAYEYALEQEGEEGEDGESETFVEMDGVDALMNQINNPKFF